MRSLSLRLILRIVLFALLSIGVVSHAMAQTGANGGPAGGGATGHGSGAPSAPGPSGSGGGGHPTTGFASDPDPIGAVQAASQAADQAIALCDTRTRRCIADALDEYATALRALAPQLPPAFRDLPVIVEQAATRVRTARTKKEAIAAVTSAIQAVHKSIALLKADDPVALRAETRASSFVIQTLQVADDKLEKAVGL
jgi:hypothetical protein